MRKFVVITASISVISTLAVVGFIASVIYCLRKRYTGIFSDKLKRNEIATILYDTFLLVTLVYHTNCTTKLFIS